MEQPFLIDVGPAAPGRWHRVRVLFRVLASVATVLSIVANIAIVLFLATATAILVRIAGSAGDVESRLNIWLELGYQIGCNVTHLVSPATCAEWR